VDGGDLRENGAAGLRVVDGRRVDISRTRVIGNRDGIVLAGTAAPTTVKGAVITGTRRLGISVTGGVATVAGNQVNGAETGIRIQDAAVQVTGNVVTRGTAHAVSVLGTSAGSSVTGNTLSGRGPSGLDTFRLAPDVAIEMAGNDVEGWTRDRDNWEYWSTFVPDHPMLLLWVLILALPLGAALGGRKRRIPVGTAPYQYAIRRERPAALLVDVGRGTATSGSA
jgi:hypothetical protein